MNWETSLLRANYPFQITVLARALSGISFVAGGAARALVFDIPHLDIDLFCYSKDGLAETIHTLETLGYTEDRDSSYAYTFTPPEKDYVVLPNHVPVQIVNPELVCGSPREVLEKFAFTTEQFAYQGKSRSVINSQAGYLDARDRTLHLVHVNNPLTVMYRVTKYIKKGYAINPDELENIMEVYRAASRNQVRRWQQESEYQNLTSETVFDTLNLQP